MTIGKRIKERREQLGLTQEALAKAINTTKQNIYKYENGIVTNIPSDKIEAIASVLHTTPPYLMGWDSQTDYISVTGMISVYGSIHCGNAALAEQYIEDRLPTTLANPERYFALRARGDSMTGAGIVDGSIVTLRKQDWADSGEIVACGMAGELATLKRMKISGNTILLLPENPAYEPIVLTKEDFDNRNAYILGVAVEVSRKL